MRYSAYTPTFVPTPADSAAAAVDTSAYVLGSQKNSGTSAALTPKAKTNTMPTAATMRLSGSSATFTARSAMFSVPVSAYSPAIASSRNADDTELIKRNLNDSFSCPARPPWVKSRYDEIRMSSKKTYRVKMSPVISAPLTEPTENMITESERERASCGPMERSAKNSEAAAVTTAISISSADKRSTAMTMPKGAGQPPSSYTMMPSPRRRTVGAATTYKTENGL